MTIGGGPPPPHTHIYYRIEKGQMGVRPKGSPPHTHGWDPPCEGGRGLGRIGLASGKFPLLCSLYHDSAWNDTCPTSVITCGSKNQKDICLKEIGLHAQNMRIILGSILNITEGTYMIIH